MKYICIIFIFFTFSTNIYPSWSKISNILSKRDQSLYPLLVKYLINEKMYFTAIPFMKEYLVDNPKISSNTDRIIDELVNNVGIKQFEVLPTNILRRSSAPILRYILAKKIFYGRKI